MYFSLLFFFIYQEPLSMGVAVAKDVGLLLACALRDAPTKTRNPPESALHNMLPCRSHGASVCDIYFSVISTPPSNSVPRPILSPAIAVASHARRLQLRESIGSYARLPSCM